MSSLLNINVEKMRSDYTRVLENARSNLNSTDSKAVIDEIGVFWYKNKSLVNCVLKHNHKKFDAGFYTAAISFDPDGAEIIPFLLINEVHFWDDIIPSYACIDYSNCDLFDKKMKKYAEDAIEGNIRLLNEMPYVDILPIRYCSDAAKECAKMAEKFFIALFRNICSKEEYEEKIHTSSDILEHIKAGYENIPIIEGTHTLADGLNEYRRKFGYMWGDCDDGRLFYIATYSYFLQCLDIISNCISFGLVPFMRDRLSFHYFTIIMQLYEKDDLMYELYYKTTIYNSLYLFIDPALYQGIDVKTMINANLDYKFEKRLFAELSRRGVDHMNFENNYKTIKEVEIQEIMSFLNVLKS